MNRIPQQPPPKRLTATPKAWRPSRTAVRATALIGISLLSGFAFRVPQPEQVMATNATPPVLVSEASAVPVRLGGGTETTRAIIIEEPAIQELPDGERGPFYLESVSLDPEVQNSIWEVCHEDPRLFATVMGIANKESRFKADAIGDSGNSLGLMQVQPRWHQERMDRLGATDLMDPVQNARVAVDYIYWIAERLNPEHPEDAYGTEMLLMAYNQGWWGAEKSWDNGTTSTSYSREVSGYIESYLTEMEVAP